METITPVEVRGPLGMLRGVVHAPADRAVRGEAITLHGFFSSNRVGPARLYVQLARLLSESGYRVWRFDCYGVGDSDGNFREASYESQLNDYQAVLNFVKREGASQFVLAGHSMGTSLAVQLAVGNVNVTRLLLISPSVGPVTWANNLFSPDQIEEMRRTGRTIRKGLEIAASFFEALQKDKTPLLEQLKIPVTVVHGTADKFYSRDSCANILQRLQNGCLIEIPDADHNFLNRGTRGALLENLKQHVGTWHSCAHDTIRRRQGS